MPGSSRCVPTASRRTPASSSASGVPASRRRDGSALAARMGPKEPRRTLEVLLRPKAEGVRVEHGREALDEGVVGADGLVVAHALDGDSVLGAGELVGETGELLVRLQIGVALGDGEQAPERATQL